MSTTPNAPYEPFLLQHPRVQFGFGKIAALPGELALLGIERPLLITDQGLVDAGVFETVRRVMGNTPYATFENVPENPTVEGVEHSLEIYRAEGCDGVVTVGGGSVIDSAKGLCVVATHAGRVPDFFGHPERITAKAAKLIAIPTTAGTGSEANTGAGIHLAARVRSAGINSPHIVPKVAICDPDLTMTLPRALTAGTGMDALTHAVEQFLAKGDNAHGDAIALDSIRRVFAWVEQATDDGANRQARWHMMMAAMQAMMPLKGLGPAHAIANTCSDQDLHHGMMVTTAMPAVLRLHETRIAGRVKKLAAAMPLKPGDAPSDAVAELNRRLGIPPTLRALGYRPVDVTEMAADAFESFFNTRAPYHPSKDDYRNLFRDALG